MKEGSVADVGGERESTRNRGFDLFHIKVCEGEWRRHGGVLCSVGAPAVPASDFILSPGKRHQVPRPSLRPAPAAAPCGDVCS